VLQEKKRIFAACYVDEVKMYRLTMTVPLLNNSRNTFFFLAGAEKAEVVKEVLHGPRKPEDLPASLTSYVQERSGYDYQHHAEVGSDNASFVSDEVVDRFCLVGPVEAHRQKLKKLAEVGVTQFNIYLMCGDEEETLKVYQRDVVPGFRG